MLIQQLVNRLNFALDSIHVATAEILRAEAGAEALEFWTHDERQSTAALSRGLTVRGI